MKNAPTSSGSDTIAASRNAACAPAAPASASDAPDCSAAAVTADMTAIIRAMPAAPATCWIVPTTAEPWE